MDNEPTGHPETCPCPTCSGDQAEVDYEVWLQEQGQTCPPEEAR